jgi:metallo-beta-lactamase family protein
MARMTTPTVRFWGAAHTVTGSMHLLDTGSHRLLLDCGLFQGRRDEAQKRNTSFPIDPAKVEAVILSHAHLDHCGNLPGLVRRGFCGPIYCTPATRDLAAVMLGDSAKIQEEDAAYLNKNRQPGQPPIQPLYTREDVTNTIKLCQSIPYECDFDTKLDVQFRFFDAGHLLGSAMMHLTITANGRQYSLTFTGDLGRPGQPIIRDPEPVPPAPTLICESTYGGKSHDPVTSLTDQLGQVVERTTQRGGKVLIPAFSLGRTQQVVFYLHQLIAQGRCTDLPIYVDSPLATEATAVFRLHPECFRDELNRLLDTNPDIFGTKRIHYIRTVDESKALNSRSGPCVIIASSGMCESGRILHHLKHNISDPRNTVLLIGYQAPDTLGSRIAQRQPQVRVLDTMLPLRAEVNVMSGFSGHADQAEMLKALAPLASSTAQVCLVHGEVPSSDSLAKALTQAGFKKVKVPDRGETVELV